MSKESNIFENEEEVLDDDRFVLIRKIRKLEHDKYIKDVGVKVKNGTCSKFERAMYKISRMTQEQRQGLFRQLEEQQ